MFGNIGEVFSMLRHRIEDRLLEIFKLDFAGVLHVYAITVFVRPAAFKKENHQRVAVFFDMANLFTFVINRFRRTLESASSGLLFQLIQTRLNCLIPARCKLFILFTPLISCPASNAFSSTSTTNVSACAP